MPQVNVLIALDPGETFAHLAVLSAIWRGLSKKSQATLVNGTPATDYLVQHYEAKTVQFPHYTFDISLALMLLLDKGLASMVSGQVLTMDYGALAVYLVNRREAGHSLVVRRDGSVYYWLAANQFRGNLQSFAERLADSIKLYEEQRKAPSRTSNLYTVQGSSLELREVCEVLGIDGELFRRVDIEIKVDTK